MGLRVANERHAVTLSWLSVPPAGTGAYNEAEAISPEPRRSDHAIAYKISVEAGLDEGQDVCEDRPGSKLRIQALEKGAGRHLPLLSLL
jgi:hypothetical protein